MKKTPRKKIFLTITLVFFFILGALFTLNVSASHGITAAQQALLNNANFPQQANVTVESIIARLPQGYEVLQDERGLWYVRDGQGNAVTSYFPEESDAAVKIWLMINGDGGI